MTGFSHATVLLEVPLVHSFTRYSGTQNVHYCLLFYILVYTNSGICMTRCVENGSQNSGI